MDKGKNIYWLMVLAALFWAGAFIAGKFAVPYIPTFTLTFLRFFFASLVLFFLTAAARRKEGGKAFRLKREHVPVFLFTGIVGMFGYHVFFFIALKYTTAINSSIIGAMNPIVTTIIAALFLRAKIPGRQAVGIALSFIGVVLTISGASWQTLSSMSFNRGDLWMLAAVVCWAAYGVFSKSKGSKIPPFWLTYYSFLVCTLILIPFAVWEKPWRILGEIPAAGWIAVLYMSIFASVGGYLIQQIAIKRIGPSRTSIFINLVPVFSMALAVLILGETLEPVKLATAGIIIAGVCICQLSGRGEEKG
ncbi:DMT family transporter [Anaerovorax odorimutans]|uniref:DMT family transporter n=1 Tax=Anaerovorax odorimutans TaxID=109327 RepID=A0ABT1RTA5_9FIRM|nr:DMT family transporter [Anaerovorax odorimutans]MCQ4638435.1 DMT family transporter [Anaerovorax odorimutans]